jgi:hypothetical protein
MLRWALGIRPGGKWLESKVERLPENGFRLQAWNRIPGSESLIKVAAKDVGLQANTEVLRVQLSEPAFRLPAVFEVVSRPDKISLKVSRPARIRLYYHVLCPNWNDKPVLERHLPDGVEAVRGDVVWESNWVEWRASPGEYDLHIVQR